MFHYTSYQWLFVFYTYCFLGWCFESAYVSLKSNKLINRGFMRGPFLVVSMPFADHIVLTYIAGCVGATALEYITGVTMEALFKVRYWDYSNKRFNFQGQICLSSTLAWGFFTVLMTRVLHRPIDRFVLSVPDRVLYYATAVLTVYIVIDFTLSFKAALDIRDILVKMQGVKEELTRMQRRLDVIVAFNNEEKEQKKQERELSMAELSAGIKQRFAELKESIQSKPSAYGASIREDNALDFFKRDMIRNNPTMASGRFKESLDELKHMADRKKGH